MDLIIKDYFDIFRKKDELPDELKSKVKGVLIKDQNLLNKWRNWRTGLSFIDKDLNAKLFGALDDCLVDNDFYMPLDYKTRGFGLKENTVGFYINQLSFYSLLLEKNGYKTNNLSYLVFYMPDRILEHKQVRFNIEVKPVKTDINLAYKLFKEAVETLRGPLPPFEESCQYCQWYKRQESVVSEKDLFSK
jgi:hypothetical protein